ncbi:MAG: hypothetical protein E3J71_03660 [Candidatus Stahlbacteria bacterium]|nr:MAG: hypothetical protein E3J71_03660 [Candidatus Stahlbacteria bacterium]
MTRSKKGGTMRLRLIVGTMLLAAASLAAAERLKKEFEVGPAPELTVDVDAGRVTVHRGEGDKITVYVQLPDREGYRLSSDQDGDEVRVDLEHRGLIGWFFFPFDVISGDEPWVRVEVPARCDLDLAIDAGRIEVKGGIEGTIKARTGAGSIRMNDVGGDVRAMAASGSIHIDEAKGTVDAETSTGEIRVQDSKGEFYLETSAGSIEIERTSGRFRVRSSVGSIDFDGTITEGEDNLLKTSVGSIRARLSGLSDIEIDAETEVGSVSIFPGIEPVDEGEHYLRVRIGDGSKRLRLRSETGSIRIEKGSRPSYSDPYTPKGRTSGEEK